MTTPRRYSRAPITEAIIDFQVELPQDVELPDLERCQDAAYPEKMGLSVTAGHIALGNEPLSSPTSRQGRFLFSSADKKQFFLAHFEGFTMLRLAPYEGWESFRDEARRLWARYRQATRPRKVTRVAVRYINRLDLPSPVVEMKDYLRTSPEVSPDLPQELGGFFMQLNIDQPDIKSTLVLRESAVPPAGPGVESVLLDIDLFRSDGIPPDEAGIWAFIESLHSRMNEIFEACITDRTREVIQ